MSAVSRTVAPNSTENLHTGQMPPYMVIELMNTGGPGDPSLQFCLSSSEAGSCPVAGSVIVAAEATEGRAVNQLGNPLFMYLNVTNSDPVMPGECMVQFPLNWQRLGLMEEQVMEWESRGKAWGLKYDAAKSDLTRTPTVIDEKNNLFDAFTAFAEPVLNQIAGSLNITAQDYNVFKIAPPNKERNPRSKMHVAPITGLKGEDGCHVRIINRRDHDATRASLDPQADGVEVRFAVLDLNAPAPVSPEACRHTFVSTRALFSHGFGVENAGKRVHLFTRWANLRDPEKSSPWSIIQSIVLS